MSVLVGKQAPDFNVKAVKENQVIESFTLSQFKNKNYVILFFYPFDFTFVCPTELHAFQDHLSEFEKRGVQVIGASTDSIHSHLAWLNTPKAKGGIKGVTYPILADFNKEVAKAYDVLVDGLGAAYRGLFLIDKTGTVRHQVVNDLPLGRSVEEALRMVDALQFNEAHGEVCPADWKVGKKAMKANRSGVESYFTEAETVRA
jgi:peroxiredoxin (alkyl hydroperoxide reductase subunit C)